MQNNSVEQEIKLKAKEWVDEYGGEFLVELIDVYLEDTPKRLEQLRMALESGDGETLTREAHTLKSSSANVGAMSLSALAKTIEAAARQGRAAEANAEVGCIESGFVEVQAVLEAIRSAAAADQLEL